MVTAKDRIATLFAKKMGWWDSEHDDFCSTSCRHDAYDFADMVMDIVRNT